MISKKFYKNSKLSPVQIISLGFLIIILFGSLLLTLPIASANNTATNYIDALFTATTSVCVTGLVTVTTMVHWSWFGKVVILCLIQIGGLGFMTAITLIFSILKRKMSVTNKLTTQSLMNQSGINKIGVSVRKVVLCTFAIEFTGAVFITISLLRYYDLLKAIKYGVFTAISAFCNAGIDIMSLDSLVSYNNNSLLLWSVMLLIIFGGIGFPVWWELFNIIHKMIIEKKNWRVIKNGISLHFKLVIIATAILIFGGFLLIFISEYNNPLTMGNMSLIDKINNSMFQSVTTRTAGFASVSQTALTDSSKMVSMLCMFVGGSPGSTAGGVKTVTFVIIIVMLMAWVKGDNKANIFNRNISESMIKRAFLITFLSMSLLFVAILILTRTENTDILTLSYECVSALATVGLSLDFTPNLTVFGKLIIILLMFMGRIGPITLFLSMSKEKKAATINYSEEKVILG